MSSAGGGNDTLYAITSQGTIYRETGIQATTKYDDSSWEVVETSITGSGSLIATHVAVNPADDSKYCFIGEQNLGNGGTVYCNTGKGSNGGTIRGGTAGDTIIKLPSGAGFTRLAIKPTDGYPIGINGDYNLYEYDGTTWKIIGGDYQDIAIGPKGPNNEEGYIWGVRKSDGRIVYDIKEGGIQWEFPAAEQATRIAIDQNNVAWIIGYNKRLYKYTGTSSMVFKPKLPSGCYSRQYTKQKENCCGWHDVKPYKYCAVDCNGFNFYKYPNWIIDNTGYERRLRDDGAWRAYDVACKDRIDIGHCYKNDHKAGHDIYECD